ncbi:MAG: serine hydrolase domain-containing protein [Pseudomonadota bacterium]
MRTAVALMLAIGFLASAKAAPSSETAAPFESTEDFVAAELRAAGAPGLAYVAVDNGAITAHAYGQVRAGGSEKVSPHTRFVIGSISKSFTALAIMMLVEAGAVDLDGKVSQYLDVFQERPTGKITVRQLLSHTSGYSTKQGNDTHTDETDNGDDLQRQVAQIAAWSPAHTPDARWQYSNANYIILGVLIERVSGETFASFIESKILDPLGMEQSFVADDGATVTFAVGHQPWFGGKRPFEYKRTARVTAPAGGVVSTASDLGLYLAMMLNDADDLISAKSKAAMMRPASAASPFYGLGWYINTDNGDAYHGGLSPGIETRATLSREENKGVVVLINANSGIGFGVNTALLYGVSAKALGRDFENRENLWGPRSLFLMFAILPVLFVLGIIRLGFDRQGLYAKTGAFGAFSLWFPVGITLALAWTCWRLIPLLFGTPLNTLALYQPDFVLTLIATAASGVIWAVLRIGLFYVGKPAGA